MNKHEIARTLKSIGFMLELVEDSPYRARAYYNGARTIETLPVNIEELIAEDKLRSVKDIGPALAEVIKELVLTNKSRLYEDLKNDLPAGIWDVARVPGLGNKRVRILYNQLKISNLRELEYACKENRLKGLEGFGEKLQTKILKGIEFLKAFKGHFYYAESFGQGREIVEVLKKNPHVMKVDIAGSLRRKKEIVKDIDIVAAGEDTEEIIDYFCQMPQVQEILEQDDKKVKVKLEKGIKVDIHVVLPHEYPFALHDFTGSREHNNALREYAYHKGFILNEYALYQGENKVVCKVENDIYLRLGLQFIPPELRENMGEIEAACKGALPELVSPEDIKGLFHVHTHYSDGADSLEDLVRAAQKMGYSYIGISDHSQSAYYAHGLKIKDIERQQEEINNLQEKYPQILIFSGIESDIKPDGSLDYSDEILSRFDFVIASIHSHFNMTESEMTKRILKAISHPCTTMLGHPTGRLLLARQGYPLDINRVIKEAGRRGVVIELNASPARLDLDWRHLKIAKENGVSISINPDAHRIEELNDVIFGVAIARKGWLTRHDVFNCKNVKEMVTILQKKKYE